MTRDEAINILWQYDVNFEPHPAEDVMHAIDMAIEALRAQDVPDTNVGDMISKKAVLQRLTDIAYNSCKTEGQAQVIDWAKTLVCVMPSAQPDHNADNSKKVEDDVISRQAAIDALEKVAELYPWRVPGDGDSYSQYNEAWQDALNRADSEIEALQSAQPEIIRCKDCRYYQDNNNGYPHMYCKWDANETPDADDFCSGAERRTDEQTVSE